MSGENDFSERELDLLEEHGMTDTRWADGKRVATVTRQEAFTLFARYPRQLQGLVSVPAPPLPATEEERILRARYPK